MSVYAVFLNEPDETVWQKLQEEWPKRHYVLTGNMAFVAPLDITTTADIAGSLGIGGNREVPGIVIECTAYNGFSPGSLWEWLRKVQS